MPKEPALVSVIIPTYKRSNMLPRAIHSVLAQTYSNIEVIVVDDNNPDTPARKETEKCMEQFAQNPRVVYAKVEQGMGGGLARNFGVSKSSGDYIAFLDDDDIYLDFKIGQQLEFMFSGGYDVSFTDVYLFNASGQFIEYRQHRRVKSLDRDSLLEVHLIEPICPTATYMFRRQAFEKVGGFDGVPQGQDFLLMLHTIEAGLRLGYLHQAGVVQYLHTQGRISLGRNKFDGENRLYSIRLSYASRLSRTALRLIHFRHHAVLSVVGKRSGMPLFMLKHLIIAFSYSPTESIKAALRLWIDRFLYKKQLAKHMDQIVKLGYTVPNE